MPEVIQTGRYRLQRVLTGQFDGKVCLTKAFVQVGDTGPSSHRSG
uniref:Uncharacterized protein n=1 Tax=Salmonella phage vB_SE130_2P TaxID=3236707 RepID=A0AB39C4X8_9VIRU